MATEAESILEDVEFWLVNSRGARCVDAIYGRYRVPGHAGAIHDGAATPHYFVAEWRAAGAPKRPGARFIAIEGIDGSGTTLQTRALAHWVRQRGHEVIETREPSGGPIGRLIRERLHVDAAPIDPATLALLFAADRIEHVAHEIDPARRQGAVVVSDRYLLSSLAYQSVHCNFEWVQSINRAAPAPDLYLLLQVPVDVAFTRVQRRSGVRERFDEIELQRHIAGLYDKLSRRTDLGEIVVVDGTLEPEQVTAAITSACTSRGL